jgi:hypothetical protein
MLTCPGEICNTRKYRIELIPKPIPIPKKNLRRNAQAFLSGHIKWTTKVPESMAGRKIIKLR